jgi:hypothetical protein
MNKKSTIIILSLLTAAAAFVYVGMFVKVARLNAEISEIQSKIDSQGNKDAALRLSGRSLAETETERRSLGSYFVAEDGAVSLIENIESLARVAGVEVNIDSLGIEALPNQRFEKLNVRIEAVGVWGGVYKFLLLVENMPFALNIGRVLISENRDALDKASGEWVLQMNFDVLKLKKQ